MAVGRRTFWWSSATAMAHAFIGADSTCPPIARKLGCGLKMWNKGDGNRLNPDRIKPPCRWTCPCSACHPACFTTGRGPSVSRMHGWVQPASPSTWPSTFKACAPPRGAPNLKHATSTRWLPKTTAHVWTSTTVACVAETIPVWAARTPPHAILTRTRWSTTLLACFWIATACAEGSASPQWHKPILWSFCRTMEPSLRPRRSSPISQGGLEMRCWSGSTIRPPTISTRSKWSWVWVHQKTT